MMITNGNGMRTGQLLRVYSYDFHQYS